MLLQAIAVAFGSEQKVLGNEEPNEALATPDSAAAETVAFQGGWTPYQNGKDYAPIATLTHCN